MQNQSNIGFNFCNTYKRNLIHVKIKLDPCESLHKFKSKLKSLTHNNISLLKLQCYKRFNRKKFKGSSLHLGTDGCSRPPLVLPLAEKPPSVP